MPSTNVTGLYTWERASLNQKSVIDYFLYSVNCVVRHLYIDNDQYFLDVGSDHNALVLTLSITEDNFKNVANHANVRWVRHADDESKLAYNRSLVQKCNSYKLDTNNPVVP